MLYKDIPTGVKGVTAHVTCSEQANGSYTVLTSARVDADFNGNSPTVKPIKRVARNLSDVERVAQQAAFEIGRRAREAKPQAQRSKSSGALSSAVAIAFYQLRQSDDPIYPEWDVNTRRTMLKRFENRVLPLLSLYPDEELCDLDRDRLLADIEEKVRINPHAGEKTGNYRQTAKRYLAQAEIIYAALRELNPDLPDIHFVVGRSNFRGLLQPEQIRSLPEDVEEKFLRALPRQIKKAPKFVFSTVLMYDAGLRTGEAAGANPCDICRRDEYAVMQVRYQERDGKRDYKLKSENAYRDIPLSFWGISMLDQCISEFGNSLPEDGAALVQGSELSSWIKRLLTECGLDERYWDAVSREMDIHPDTDADGAFSFDASAYVLRRNAASHWLNMEGWTDDEIDACLGHEGKKAKRIQTDLRLPENMAQLAMKRERAIRDIALSRHPAVAHISLSHGTDLDIIPFESMEFVNAGDVPLLVEVNLEAAEPGELITVTVPSSGMRDWKQTNKKFRPDDRVVIGQVLEEEKYAKD